MSAEQWQTFLIYSIGFAGILVILFKGYEYKLRTRLNDDDLWVRVLSIRARAGSTLCYISKRGISVKSKYIIRNMSIDNLLKVKNIRLYDGVRAPHFDFCVGVF